MKLTAFTDYCLRVLLYVSAVPYRKATIAEIARAFEVSEHHLVKVVHFLGKKGWITTVRGKGGGMTLGRPASSIIVGRVVRDAEGELAPAECFDNSGGRCVIGGCCGLKLALGEAVHAFLAVLDRYTLADVASDRHALQQVLQVRPRAGVPAAMGS